MTPASMHRLASIVLVLLGTACDEPGDLDLESVREITLAVGDAPGDLRSGLYTVNVTVQACGCDEDSVPVRASLCKPLGLSTGATFPLSVELLQTGGRLLLRAGTLPMRFRLPEEVSLIGPVYRDGHFAVAGIRHAASYLDDGHILTLFDGSFDENEQFAGDLRHRLVGEFFLGNVLHTVDCTEQLALSDGRREIVQ